MATKRALSVSICSSESVEAMPEWPQLLLDRLIITADDFGTHEASPGKLKAITKPLSPRPPADFAAAVAEIARVGIVILYQAEDRCFLRFPKWDLHQTGLHKRTRSRFPEPSSGRSITADEYLEITSSSPVVSRKLPELPGTSGTVPLNEGTNEQNEHSSLLSDVRRTSERSVSPESRHVASRDKCDELFDRLWTLVPRKEGKRDARKHFDSLVRGLKGGAGSEVALAALGESLEKSIRNYLGKIEAERIEPRYVMQGSTLFRNADDYIDWKPVTTPATVRRFVA